MVVELAPTLKTPNQILCNDFSGLGRGLEFKYIQPETSYKKKLHSQTSDSRTERRRRRRVPSAAFRFRYPIAQLRKTTEHSCRAQQPPQRRGDASAANGLSPSETRSARAQHAWNATPHVAHIRKASGSKHAGLEGSEGEDASYENK